MKKKLLYLSYFITIFIVTVVLSFPYTTCVQYYINSFIKRNHLRCSYKHIHSTVCKTDIKNIKIGLVNGKDLTINNMMVSYNPFTLFLDKKVSVAIEDPFIKMKLYVSPKSFVCRGRILADLLNSYMPYHISGDVYMDGRYRLNRETGYIKATSPKLTIKYNGNTIQLTSIRARLKIVKNQIIIKRIASTGQPSINLKGEIILNRNKPSSSPLHIKGVLHNRQLKFPFDISGTLAHITFD